jgi:hypothetical protein
MRHQLSPNIDSLETKNLLSQMPMGLIGPQVHPGGPIPVEAPVTPVIGMPVSPVVGRPVPPVIGRPVPPVVGRPAPIEMPISSLATSITTNHNTYSPGQTVAMTFTVRNDTSATVAVTIGPSVDGFSVTSGGRTVWISNSGVTPDYIVLRTLAPGQAITLTADWTAPPSMTGTFAVRNQLDPSDSATFEIGTSPDLVAAAKRARSSVHPHHVLHFPSAGSLVDLRATGRLAHHGTTH